jgi:hypothetical protein
MIRITPQTARSAPDLVGLETSAGEWRFDPSHYRQFVESTTGIPVADHPPPTDCYRIRNRLEAFVDEHRRSGVKDELLTAEHPAVDSIEEITELARFFRHCHDYQVGRPSP